MFDREKNNFEVKKLKDLSKQWSEHGVRVSVLANELKNFWTVAVIHSC